MSEIQSGFCHCGCGRKTPIARVTLKSRSYVAGEPTLYCQGHGRRKKPKPGHKICHKCRLEMLDSEFARVSKTTGYCRTCYNERQRIDWQEKESNRSWAKNYHMLRRYGVNLQTFLEMVEKQHGACAVCRQPERRHRRGKPMLLSVDHDHTTGKVRGLLCSDCNRALGFLEHDVERLQHAIHYLKLHL